MLMMTVAVSLSPEGSVALTFTRYSVLIFVVPSAESQRAVVTGECPVSSSSMVPVIEKEPPSSSGRIS